ncbi:hypothetical protein EVAR_20382_1 [Eumeta japonica]|uniref:Uncharacterized protein n=1 Tax=Eumeta variegata TaxID=151549 RepID=A0A4C1ZSQ2_EUMVA|nr:hypothetical protein EVAR_20382_1 [Eumeta japonica]
MRNKYRVCRELVEEEVKKIIAMPRVNASLLSMEPLRETLCALALKGHFDGFFIYSHCFLDVRKPLSSEFLFFYLRKLIKIAWCEVEAVRQMRMRCKCASFRQFFYFTSKGLNCLCWPSADSTFALNAMNNSGTEVSTCCLRNNDETHASGRAARASPTAAGENGPRCRRCFGHTVCCAICHIIYGDTHTAGPGFVQRGARLFFSALESVP